jgi:transcriptional regulator with XRE-family HTH domain
MRKKVPSSDQEKALRKAIGKRLKELREGTGKTQLDLSLCLGLPYATFISQIEAGLARLPTDRVGEMADCLSVGKGYLALLYVRYYEPILYQAIFAKPGEDGEDLMNPAIKFPYLTKSQVRSLPGLKDGEGQLGASPKLTA